MNTPTHDPLTEAQQAILDRAPFEATMREVNSRADAKDINYLVRIGKLHTTIVHHAQVEADSRWLYQRA